MKTLKRQPSKAFESSRCTRYSTQCYKQGELVMGLLQMSLRRIEKTVGGLCSKRTPEHLKDHLRFEYEIEKQTPLVFGGGDDETRLGDLPA